MILNDEGRSYLASEFESASEDFSSYLEFCASGEFASLVEASLQALYDLRRQTADESVSPQHFVEDISAIFAEHRVAWQLIGGEMVPLRSRELYAAVVEPTLRLLAARPDWIDVEQSYQEGLEELLRGRPGDAITDAVRALEAALGHLGFNGHSLGDRARAARKAGAIASQDTKLFDWVAASRGTLSDAHPGTRATEADAWLAVHVVGALIVRIAG